MVEILDIYTKLIIALITFVGPFLTFTLTNYRDMLKKSIVEYENEKITLLKQAEEQMSTENAIEDKVHKISKFQQQIKSIEAKRKADISQIAPKKFLIWIYGSLGFSLFCLCIFYFLRSTCSTNQKQFILVLSFIGFIIASGKILKVIWKLVDIMTRTEKNNAF